jgi:hypothetical protein
MDMNWLISGTVFGSMVLLGVVQSATADVVRVPLVRLPQAVTDALRLRFPESEVLTAEVDTIDGATAYRVALRYGEHHLRVTLTLDGAIVEFNHHASVADPPAAVSSVLETMYPSSKCRKIEATVRVVGDREVTALYQIRLVTAKKQVRKLAMTPHGHVIENERQETNSPARRYM